jgi:ribosomal protein L37AE/L43A
LVTFVRRSKDAILLKYRERQEHLVSDSKPVQFAFRQQKQKGRRAMARLDLGYLPHENPCAQCGQPIATPDWLEAGPRRISYLWQCRGCGYRFEAVAFFNDSEPDREALAA